MDTCDFLTEDKEMNIVIVGHVDHGKSTVIGRLLADTGSLPEGKLEMIKELCRRSSKPFEYAFLLDALKDERNQGITIDTARCFFKTQKRKYIIIDAPGHIEFLKNMITGASRAEAALLVIDAQEGIKENSRRHGYMLSMLGIKQVTVLINKLDLVLERDRQRYYEDISKEYAAFLNQIGMKASHFIPVSAIEGYNIAKRSDTMPWYNGMTVLEALDSFETVPGSDDLPARMWVQDVYKFTNSGDDRRIIAGTVSSGKISVGDEICFYPSGKKTTVSSIEGFNEPKKQTVTSGYATGLCMSEQIYVKRGELLCIKGQKAPLCGDAVKVSLFWLGAEPMTINKVYKLKIGTAQVGCRLEKIEGVLDASTLENTVKNKVERHEVARCVLRFDKKTAFDISGMTADTSRFVIVDNYEISGGGIITGIPEINGGEDNKNLHLVEQSGAVQLSNREKRICHKSALVFVSGNTDNLQSPAALLEHELFARNIFAYSFFSKKTEQDDKLYDMLFAACGVLLKAGNVVIIDELKTRRSICDRLRDVFDSYKVLTIFLGKTFSNLNGDDVNICDISSAADYIEKNILL